LASPSPLTLHTKTWKKCKHLFLAYILLYFIPFIQLKLHHHLFN
jgi:hypothetical protein